MDLLEVLSNMQSTSSGTGVSYYSTRCGRQAQLNKEFPQESAFDAQVGVVYHKLQELYYTGALKDIALPLDDMADFGADPVQEALRIFSKYTELYPADEWDVLYAEKLLPIEGDATMKRLIEEAVGVSPFTCRIDLVARMNEAQAAKFTERCGKEVLPGLYLVDHKVKKQKDSNAFMKWSRSVQFTAYYLAWNAAFDQDLVRGTIVNSPIRHKTLTPDSFQRFVIDAPSEMQIAAVRGHLARKSAYLKLAEPNLDACDDWSGCQHYVTGRCNRV